MSSPAYNRTIAPGTATSKYRFFVWQDVFGSVTHKNIFTKHFRSTRREQVFLLIRRNLKTDDSENDVINQLIPDETVLPPLHIHISQPSKAREREINRVSLETGEWRIDIPNGAKRFHSDRRRRRLTRQLACRNHPAAATVNPHYLFLNLLSFIFRKSPKKD